MMERTRKIERSQRYKTRVSAKEVSKTGRAQSISAENYKQRLSHRRCRRGPLWVLHPVAVRNLYLLASLAQLVLLMLTCGALRAQEYSFRYLGVADGLDNLAVQQIYQDRVGFIWVSTENGIFRYDGDRFEAFGPDQGIPLTSGAAFGDAPDGSLLVGGSFGLYRLVGVHFEKLQVPFKAVSWGQGIQSDGKGHTFIGTDSGLVKLFSEPGNKQFVVQKFLQVPGTSGPSVSGVLVDGEVVWYGCGRELCRMDGNGTRIFGRDSGLPDRALLEIRKDGNGDLWVRAQNKGMFVLPHGHIKFREPDLPAAFSATGVPAVDADGRMLLPSPDGLLIHDEHGWQQIDRSSGLRGTVYAAFEDRQHSLWIGLAGRGLAQWQGYREWESYSVGSGLASDTVYEILPRADGSLWVGTEGGLIRGLHRQSGIEWAKVPGLSGFPVHSLQTDPKGDLWVGTETRGAARIDSRTGKVQWFGEGQGLSGKAAYTLRFDREQRLWAATDAGLFMAKAPYEKFSRITELPPTRFWAVAEGTDGTMWAGGLGGLFEYAAGQWKNYTHADGLSNTEVLSLGAGANGTMWIGYRYGGGIDRIHPRPGGATIDKSVQRLGANGLVYFLQFDARGRLWVGTERGVDVWDGSNWSHYDTSDGLAWDDCNLNAFAEEADGIVWIGTSGGLSRFKPLHSLSELPLDVVFTKLALGGVDVSGRENPSIDLHSNSLVVRYSALNAAHENSVVFRYLLEGANATWVETTQRELHFAQLAPGAYRLDIEARGSDGIWSAHGAAFSFKILTPWYKTWWFAVLCGLIPLLLAAGVLRLRMLGARRREGELLRLVEAKTVELREANAELLQLSSIDPLTGLANRRVFDRILSNECARLKRTGGGAVSLLLLDVDHFKALNDSKGHQQGDRYLVLLGAELTRIARRQTDTAARCGGEEFALILPGTIALDAACIAESVRSAILALNLPHPASPSAPILTISIGVATATRDWLNAPQELVAAADAALYAAKRNGRNRVEVAQPSGVSGEGKNAAVIELA